MPTKPNPKDYGLSPSCTGATEIAEGGLARHPDPLCLSLAERMILYNQAVLFQQGKEILQALAKLTADGASTAAVDHPARAAGLGPAAAANGGTTGGGDGQEGVGGVCEEALKANGRL